MLRKVGSSMTAAMAMPRTEWPAAFSVVSRQERRLISLARVK